MLLYNTNILYIDKKISTTQKIWFRINNDFFCIMPSYLLRIQIKDNFYFSIIELRGRIHVKKDGFFKRLRIDVMPYFN